MANTPTSDNIIDSAHGPSDFKLVDLHRHFADCLREDGNLDMDKYILGYDEIYKFLNLLGTVFGWVASDVLAKIDVLKQHRQSAKGDKYESIESMIKHEIAEGIIQPKARDSTTGARNLLRLHRALDYIQTFLEQLPTMERSEKCCPVSQTAYKKTLAKHHPWVVQKAALMAMNLLPTKEGLIAKICGDSEEEYQEAVRVLRDAVSAMRAVYDKTEKLYSEHKLLDLP